MSVKKAAAALSLFTLLGTTGAQAQTVSFADYRPIATGGLAITLFPAGPQDRIQLDPSVLTKAAGRKREIPIGSGSGPAAHLKHLIGWAEAGQHGYDAVQYGARTRPSKRPTQMTIGEIYQWIARTPGQPHAIGRYQFIPSTLKTLVHELGLPHDARFTSKVQDRLADILLEDAGYSAFMAGKISRHRFMENLARIWAGFPTSTGRSYYHGYAGNRAVITWGEFDAHMKKIFRTPNG